MNIPDFYVLCTPEHSNERKHQNHRHLVSGTSEKQRQTDYARVIKYIMTTIQTSPYRMLVFKQALKVVYKEYFSFLFCFFFIFEIRNVVGVEIIISWKIYV
jgi:hypothetical protein